MAGSLQFNEGRSLMNQLCNALGLSQRVCRLRLDISLEEVPRLEVEEVLDADAERAVARVISTYELRERS